MRVLPRSAAIPKLADATDAVLIDRLRAGNVDAIVPLHARHATSLLRLAYRLTGSIADAEDVVQDVFIGLASAVARYTEQGSCEQWLRRVTTRVALMRMRRDASRHEIPIDTLPLQSEDALDDRIAERLRVDGAVRALPEKLRAVFVLRQLEQWSYDEIGRELGIRRGTAEVRFHRAIRFLRARLASR
jgi:RNA polymerase sigma-70 factor (ECF subfamily)